MLTVTAAELQKNFGRYRDLVQREPVTITHHGRESVVMIAAEDYHRLKALDTRETGFVWDLPDEDVEALRKAEVDPECAKFDHEMDD